MRKLFARLRLMGEKEPPLDSWRHLNFNLWGSMLRGDVKIIPCFNKTERLTHEGHKLPRSGLCKAPCCGKGNEQTYEERSHMKEFPFSCQVDVCFYLSCHSPNQPREWKLNYCNSSFCNSSLINCLNSPNKSSERDLL